MSPTPKSSLNKNLIWESKQFGDLSLSLSLLIAQGPNNFAADNRVERVVVMGLSRPPKRVTLTAQGAPKELTFDYDAAKKVTVIAVSSVCALDCC